MVPIAQGIALGAFTAVNLPRAMPWAKRFWAFSPCPERLPTNGSDLRKLNKLACLCPSLVAVFQYESHFLLAIHLDGERPGEADVAHVGQFFLGRKAVQG